MSMPRLQRAMPQVDVADMGSSDAYGRASARDNGLGRHLSAFVKVLTPDALGPGSSARQGRDLGRQR